MQHDGIFVIEHGCVRVFYTSPSGREITLAYWNPGNFVGGPDVLNGGAHMWSGVTVSETKALMLPSRELRQLILEIPALAVGLIEDFPSRANAILRSHKSSARAL